MVIDDAIGVGRRHGAVLQCLAVSALAGQCLPRADHRLAVARASAAFCRPLTAFATRLALRQDGRQGTARDFPPLHPSQIRRPGPDDIGLRVSPPSRPPGRRLVCGSCASDREFACRFLPVSRAKKRGGPGLGRRVQQHSKLVQAKAERPSLTCGDDAGPERRPRRRRQPAPWSTAPAPGRRSRPG